MAVMQLQSDRKEAIRAFKERRTKQGVYVVTLSAANRKWVGASRNLGAAKNGLWFTLIHGSHLNKELQAEWSQHGADAFRFDIVEELDDDLSTFAVNDALKSAKCAWVTKLGASVVV